MSHLHIPDGVLPAALWLPGLVTAVLLILVSARSLRQESPQQVAYQGALGALVLAAMAVQVPLGPIEYHLSLVGPIGVLLGPASSFQVMFVASAVLAFLGHGGLTVIGLNALVLGAGSALARPGYDMFRRRFSPVAAFAAATAVAQAVCGLLWMGLMTVGLRAHAWSGRPDGGGGGRFGVLALVGVPLWILGVAAETTVAFGIARFLARVRPDLLPAAKDTRAAETA